MFVLVFLSKTNFIHMFWGAINHDYDDDTDDDDEDNDDDNDNNDDDYDDVFSKK